MNAGNDRHPKTGVGLQWRAAKAEDATAIAAAIDSWWARHLQHFVHPLFLEHCGDTCLVVEDGGEMIAFLVGMLSQRYPQTAYVHFLGVRPGYRKLGLGRQLYERFFALVRARGCTVVTAETGAFNKQSIAFHRRLGFTLEGGDELVGGIPVTRDYHGTGADVILFSMSLDSLA